MPHPTRSYLQTLAREAGAILRDGFIQRPGFGRSLHIDYKGVIDPVTEFDHRSEEFLIREIQSRFPDHQIISEESGVSNGKTVNQWCIDPLDGTVNYAHSVPIFCVSMAYLEKGKPLIGVIYNPMQDECFSAECGAGAWLNDEPIHCSTTQDLNRSLLVTGFPYDIRTTLTKNLDEYARFAVRSQGVRRLGSAALDLSYIAAGRLDGYWELILNLWDMAAGALIASEAGALVTQADGREDVFQPPYSILAANPALHQQMLAVLRSGD